MTAKEKSELARHKRAMGRLDKFLFTIKIGEDITLKAWNKLLAITKIVGKA